MRNHCQTLLITLTLLAGVALLLLSTQKHICACPDSVIYIGVAKNFFTGAELIMPLVGLPLTHYLLLYPLLLCMAGLLQVRKLTWVLWLDILILIANLLFAKNIADLLGWINNYVKLEYVKGLEFLDGRKSQKSLVRRISGTNHDR